MSNQASTPRRDEEVARRAYDLWESEGRPEGRHEQHWAQAEDEMSSATKDEEARTASDVRADPIGTPDDPAPGAPAAVAAPKRRPAKRRTPGSGA